MRHASLFSGIGGFDLAAEWMGWTNVFSCEIEEFPRKVLQHHFPNTIHYEDVKQTDFTIHRGEIDILTGGFPCQPYSSAGKRLGKEDERHLWPEMLRAVRETQPTFVVGENVRGFLTWNGGLVLDEVFADLEDLGYGVEAFVLPAAGINAPHRRDRVWIVAWNTKSAGETEIGKISTKRTRHQTSSNTIGIHDAGIKDNVAHSKEIRWNGRRREYWKDIDTDRDRMEQCGQERSAMGGESKRHSKSGNAPNTCIERSFWSDITGRESNIRRQDSQIWRDATGHGQANDWLHFPTQSPICGGDDGIPGRLDGISFPKWRRESIKAYGNAIVPQIAYRIFKAIELTNQKMEK